ncbi:MAG: helix-turn-helix transcriptional regulator [Bacillota bacterium]
MLKTKPNTKDRVLDLLKKEVSLSVNALTEQLSITHMAVRKHLTSLENDGLIQSVECKQPMGRPLQLYSLTEKGEKVFPKNYEGITLEFLKDIEEIYGEDSIHLLFKKRENRLATEYSTRIQTDSMLEKMSEIVKIQNEKGYMASASQIDEGSFELIEYNCPIYSVAQEYKMACHCETEMFKKVVGTDQVHRTSCKTDGDSHCKFVFRFNS